MLFGWLSSPTGQGTLSSSCWPPGSHKGLRKTPRRFFLFHPARRVWGVRHKIKTRKSGEVSTLSAIKESYEMILGELRHAERHPSCAVYIMSNRLSSSLPFYRASAAFLLLQGGRGTNKAIGRKVNVTSFRNRGCQLFLFLRVKWSGSVRNCRIVKDVKVQYVVFKEDILIRTERSHLFYAWTDLKNKLMFKENTLSFHFTV